MHPIPHILLIDDEIALLTALEAVLRKQGYQVSMAKTGQEGLAMAKSLLPDLILLDVVLPDLNGYEVCATLKNSRECANIPVLLATSLGEKEDVVRGFNAGADDYLTKPIEIVVLLARVRNMIKIKQRYDSMLNLSDLRQDLVDMIVHDMRSRLQIILGHTERLNTDEDVIKKHHTRIKSIHSEVVRLQDFLDDMLLTAKMEADQLTISREDTDINSLVEEVSTAYVDTVRVKHQILSVDVSSGKLLYPIDRQLFVRVIDNLLSNALKFSPPGGTITINTGLDRENLYIQVCDEGPGIPPEKRLDIFNKFSAPLMRKQGMRQVGLGLAFCKMVVSAHGGTIEVIENEPVGSCFVLRIPSVGMHINHSPQ